MTFQTPAPIVGGISPMDPPISWPGRYQLSAERYHDDCCDGPSVSASGLWRFWNDSPAHYWTHSYLNPEREPESRSAALDFGRAAHALILADGTFEHNFIRSPYRDFRSKEAREWRDAQEAEGRTALDNEQASTITQMAAALMACPAAIQAFHDGQSEASFLWKDAPTGLWLKSRPDWVTEDPSRPLYDYKTAARAHPDDISRDCFRFGRHVQAALALDAVEILQSERRPAFALIVQEKAPPYAVTVASLSEDQVAWGRWIARQALDRLAWCLDAGHWPAYAEEAVAISWPAWELKKAQTLTGRAFHD